MKPIRITPDKLIVGQDTHEGETGKNNEDTGGFFAFQVSAQNHTEVYLGIVGDGIGGHQAGERASQLGVGVIENYFRQVASPALTDHFQQAFQMANAQIVAEGQSDPRMRGMGTTMTAAAIMNGRLYTAHVGDSRAYLIRDGAIHQLTVDHTWAQEAIEAGRLTPAEAKQHPNRNVIKRYMGIQSDMEVDFRLANPDDPTGRPSEANQGLPLRPGDTILVCSDGLSDMVPDEDILQEVDNHPPQPAARRLTMKARQNGGYDNITVVLMQLPGKKAPAGAVAAPAVAPAVAVPARKRSMVPILGVILVVVLFAVLAVLALPTIKELMGGEPTATSVPLATEAATPTVAPTETPVPSPSATSTTEVVAPAVTPSATEEEVTGPTETPAATPTPVPTFTPTNTRTPTNTPRPPTVTPTPTATDTPSSAPPSGPKPGKTEPPPR
jgi:serine/threonine protein phosphatase PrpC